MDYGFDVPGLQIRLHGPLAPTSIRFGFRVEYDKIPPLKVRRMKRVLDCSIRSLRPVDYNVTIVEQLER